MMLVDDRSYTWSDVTAAALPTFLTFLAPLTLSSCAWIN